MHDAERLHRKKESAIERCRFRKTAFSSVHETTTLCQPDLRKGCTACCGLFNFVDISCEHLEGFLADGAARSSTCLKKKDSEDCGNSAEVRDKTSYICPHQGLLLNTRPGCLLHPHYQNTALRNEGFFGESICDGFICPAHSILTGEEKRIIIDLLDDWYLYTVAIIDPTFTSWLITYVKETRPLVYACDDALKSVLEECLMIHAAFLSLRKGPIFFYSLPEYRAGKSGVSHIFFEVEKAKIDESLTAMGHLF